METNDFEITDEDTSEIELSEEELNDDSVDWKAKAAELEGIAKRRTTQLKKAKIAIDAARKLSKLELKKEQKSGELDYSQLAYLKASGIEHPDEIAFITKELHTTGKELREVLGFNYLKEELTKMRNTRDVQDNIPPTSPRSSTTIHDNVDWWINKKQLPPIEQQELRRKVVAERRKREENQSKFTDQPVIR